VHFTLYSAELKLETKRKNELKNFLKLQKIKFNDLELLDLALSHRSFANEKNTGTGNNEKLEFLGDSVLGLIITEFLYKNYSDLHEGDFARVKSFIVSEEMLCLQGKNIGLNKLIKIGHGEEMTGGREKKAIIADAFEAFLGAVYLDSKYSRVEDFIIRLFAEEIKLVINERHGQDYKTLLQEFVQKKYRDCPQYRQISESGPEHNKTFLMEVLINKEVIAQAYGKSKKEAEKNAAKIAYEKITQTSSNVSNDKNQTIENHKNDRKRHNKRRGAKL
jgi:ribonuclease-3